MMSILEPMILLVMAGVVLLIILAIMLPIMDMTSGLGG
jgi:type II secretory pathway component PulF